MFAQCQGRIAKDENLTFGDKKTKFYIEEQCPAQILQTEHQLCCKDCLIESHGLIDEPLPQESRIFGPTKWFLETWEQCGAPSREALKVAIAAHNKVSMGRRPSAQKADPKEQQQQQQQEPFYYETTDTIQVAEIIENHALKTKRVKNKTYYIDPLTEFVFEKTKDGFIKPIKPLDGRSISTTQGSVVQ